MPPPYRIVFEVDIPLAYSHAAARKAAEQMASAIEQLESELVEGVPIGLGNRLVVEPALREEPPGTV